MSICRCLQRFNLKIGSIESLITGGVSFRVPKGNEPGELITKDMSRFRLYNNLKRVKERFFDEYLEYVMLFDESVRGLNTGARWNTVAYELVR